MKELTISEFVKKAISEIEVGLPQGYSIDGAVDFEISVAASDSKSGGIHLKVVSGEKSGETEIVQTITFSVISRLQQSQDGKRVIKQIVKGIKEISKLGSADD